MLLLKVIAVAALAVAAAAAVIVFSMPGQANPGAPNVKFTDFTADRVDIRVGEATNIVFNVQNLESRSITDARVITVIEPSVDRQTLSIDRPTVELPDLQSKDARTGQMQVTITAVSTPAIEATYKVKGVLIVEGTQSDVREFELKIRQ
ncbi:MAG TPA: hypothetical protein VFS46_01320 [Nitrososphaera sp.]|nr:hypothetical protein [Nitrososphaera sp.]